MPAADPVRGTGRICELAVPEPLHAFVERARRGLPYTSQGIRVAGDLDAPVRVVAVYVDAARDADVDAYLTADLRHHPASESMERGRPALVDVAHWASEWPWLGEAADLVRARLSANGDTVETRVSRIITDPWTARLPSDDNREQP